MKKPRTLRLIGPILITGFLLFLTAFLLPHIKIKENEANGFRFYSTASASGETDNFKSISSINFSLENIMVWRVFVLASVSIIFLILNLSILKALSPEIKTNFKQPLDKIMKKSYSKHPYI